MREICFPLVQAMASKASSDAALSPSQAQADAAIQPTAAVWAFRTCAVLAHAIPLGWSIAFLLEGAFNGRFLPPAAVVGWFGSHTLLALACTDWFQDRFNPNSKAPAMCGTAAALFHLSTVCLLLSADYWLG
jgi:hypothetical protein